jgi:hypothetical protein
MHILYERFVFGGDDRGFLKEVAKTYLMAPTSPLNTPTFCLSSHLLSMYLDTVVISRFHCIKHICELEICFLKGELNINP